MRRIRKDDKRFTFEKGYLTGYVDGQFKMYQVTKACNKYYYVVDRSC